MFHAHNNYLLDVICIDGTDERAPALRVIAVAIDFRPLKAAGTLDDIMFVLI